MILLKFLFTGKIYKLGPKVMKQTQFLENSFFNIFFDQCYIDYPRNEFKFENFVINLIYEYYDVIGLFINQNIKFGNEKSLSLGGKNILIYHYKEQNLFYIETLKNQLT